MAGPAEGATTSILAFPMTLPRSSFDQCRMKLSRPTLVSQICRGKDSNPGIGTDSKSSRLTSSSYHGACNARTGAPDRLGHMVIGTGVDHQRRSIGVEKIRAG